MTNRTVKTRYLMTCASNVAMDKATKLLATGPSATSLISSTANRRRVSRDAGVINRGIRVISAALTRSQHQKVKKSRVCRIEEDLHAFACVRPTQVAAAVGDFPYPWGVKKIDADIVWIKTKGNGVRVAVLDTGVDACHPNLKANVKKGVSLVENVTFDRDDNGHGTHCAGIIAANLPSGKKRGNNWIYGVAPEVSIVPVKVLNYNGDGLLSAILGGLEWCLHNKIDIVSMSFRIPSDSQSYALEQACMTLWERGLLLVAATGNDRQDKKGTGGKRLTVGYPAKYDSVLGVGATDRLDTIAPFSNTGEGVDLVAPGVGILSTYRANRYRELSGTSQACPHVAGVAALLKSYRSTLTNENIKKVLLGTADPLGMEESDDVYGTGLLNATGAIEQLDVILG